MYIRTENGVEKLTQEEYELRFPQTEPTQIEKRIVAYGNIGSQLDVLWHDIDIGVFGDSAKSSEFYTRISVIKELYPK